VGEGQQDEVRDLSRLVVALRGSLERTGDLFEPFRLVDARGGVVAPAGAYLRELAACGRPAATQRSYGMDLLRWFRFLWAVEIGGIRRRGWRLGISVPGSSSLTSRRGRIGAIPTVVHRR
jgi:hypothetical protein